AEDGIRDGHVTGVQTCALPILAGGDRSVQIERLIAILSQLDIEYQLVLPKATQPPRDGDSLCDINGDFQRLYGVRGAFLYLIRRSEERRVGKECRCGWRLYH